MKNRSKRKVDLKSSLLVLLLIAILLIASTYAWFTANETVTVSELEVNVQAQNGLQISADGTNWKSILSIEDLKPENLTGTYDTNTNQIPDMMEPVSTIGNVTSGKLDMFYGTVTASDEGGYELTATKQTDTQGVTGKYVAFDIFLKVDAETPIVLTPESNVIFKDMASKGLENAARVAFLNEGNQPTGTLVSTIQGLTGAQSLGTGDTTKLWEPNYDVHTPAGVANAQSTYGKPTTEGPDAPRLDYYGVKADIVDGIDITTTEEPDNNTYFSQVTPSITTTKAQNGNNSDLYTLQAGITKVRIYMWIEGQDVDCENSASGANIAFNLQFTIKE